MGLATAFSVFVGVMALLRGSTVYDELGGVTTFQMAVFYYSAGVTGGTLVGLLRPIQHRYVGRFITAFLTLFLVYGGCSLVFLPALNEESANPVSAKFMLVACALLSLIVAPLYVRIVGSWRSE